MKQTEEDVLLRIFIDESDMYKGRPLYEQIVVQARTLHLAGATVIRGIMGYGAHSRVHTAKILQLSEALPVVVEIVDSKENIDKLIPFLDETVKEGLITKERVQVIRYRSP